MTPEQLAAMEQALEALYPISHNSTDDYRGQADKAITALRTAIEQAKKQPCNPSEDGVCEALECCKNSPAAPVQEPVALCCGHAYAAGAIKWNPFNGVVQCHNCGQTYTTPPAAPVQEPVAWAVVGVGDWGEWSIGDQFEISNPPNPEYWETRGYGLVPLYTHPSPAAQPAYDQTALELCEVCGWKTLIPGDVCLNCEHEAAARRQWVGLTKEQRDELAALYGSFGGVVATEQLLREKNGG